MLNSGSIHANESKVATDTQAMYAETVGFQGRKQTNQPLEIKTISIVDEIFRVKNPRVIGIGTFKITYACHLRGVRLPIPLKQGGPDEGRKYEIVETYKRNKKREYAIAFPHTPAAWNSEDPIKNQEQASFDSELNKHEYLSSTENKIKKSRLCIGHKVTVTFNDNSTQDGIITRKMDGVLVDYLQHTKGLSDKKLRKIAIDVAKGALALHEAGILHLDISIYNVFIKQSKSGHLIRAYLGDLGSSSKINTPVNQFTRLPIHLFPDDFIKNPRTPFSEKTDAYQFGIFLYALCSPSGPHQAMELFNPQNYNDFDQFLERRRDGDRWPWFRSLPDEFQSLILDLTKPHPKDRISIQDALLVLSSVDQ